MALRVVTTGSIRQTDLRAWQQVADSADDFLMDPRLLEASEASMGVGTAGARASGCDTRFWYLLAYAGDDPVGAACVTEYPLDTMVLADRFSRWFVGHVRRVFPRYLKFRVTWCGLPISIAGSNLRVVPGADTGAVVRALNEAVERISRERQTWLVIYKELDNRDIQLAATLEADGYVRGESLPMNRIVNRWEGFAGMLASMRSHYRYKIARSRKKMAAAGLTIVRTTGCDDVERLYTPALHAMYERVTLQAEHRLEVLPREFFLELAARYGEELVLTRIMQGDRVLAFAWSMQHRRLHRNLFVGIDYEKNDETDAYFNLMVEDIAYAMDRSSAEIYVGQSADDFKSRLGCTTDPRYVLIKLTNRFLHWCFLRWKSSFLTPIPPPPERDVFKEETASASEVATA